MEILIAVVSLALGAVAGAAFNEFIKRPRLKAIGSSGGSVVDGQYQALQVANVPGLLGLVIRGTTILGRRIHDDHTIGLTFERRTARECVADLFDKSTGRVVSRLHWCDPTDASATWTMTADLRCDRRGQTIGLFAKGAAPEPTSYYPFVPDDPSRPEFVSAFGSQTPLFSGSREFEVRVMCPYGGKRLVVPVSVEENFDGSLQVIYGRENGGGF